MGWPVAPSPPPPGGAGEKEALKNQLPRAVCSSGGTRKRQGRSDHTEPLNSLQQAVPAGRWSWPSPGLLQGEFQGIARHPFLKMSHPREQQRKGQGLALPQWPAAWGNWATWGGRGPPWRPTAPVSQSLPAVWQEWFSSMAQAGGPGLLTSGPKAVPNKSLPGTSGWDGRSPWARGLGAPPGVCCLAPLGWTCVYSPSPEGQHPFGELCVWAIEQAWGRCKSEPPLSN